MADVVRPGAKFNNRKELAASGLHRQQQAGIAWTSAEGAYSIVLSGGYEDDEDYGSIIIYTGEGGRDPVSGHQIADQTLSRGNLALAKCKHEGTTVNVIRGAAHKSRFSPIAGYVYAGKYLITDYWPDKGRSGKRIYRFRLEATDTSVKTRKSDIADLPPAERRAYTGQRLVRDTKQTMAVKEMYKYACQVCGLSIELPLNTRYAEGAHIKPLGRPHDGPDDISNLLCLCPNHHVMFDNYIFSIDPDTLALLGGLTGHLTVSVTHQLNPDFIRYHNKLFAAL